MTMLELTIAQRRLEAEGLRSLVWGEDDDLVDWVAGRRYWLDGRRERLNVGSGYRFDDAAGVGPYGVRFECLGTKGLVMRDNGQRPQGNVVALDGVPRVIDLRSGEVIHRFDDLDGGPGVWQPSYAAEPAGLPVVARDPRRSRFAIGRADGIDVVELRWQ